MQDFLFHKRIISEIISLDFFSFKNQQNPISSTKILLVLLQCMHSLYYRVIESYARRNKRRYWVFKPHTHTTTLVRKSKQHAVYFANNIFPSLCEYLCVWRCLALLFLFSPMKFYLHKLPSVASSLMCIRVCMQLG